MIAVLAACDLLVSPEDLVGDPVVAANDASTGDAGASESPLARGLVAYWSFDETEGLVAHDQSDGGANHATVEGSASWTAGRVRGAIAFDGGATGVVRVPENGTLQLAEQLTIAFWINLAVATSGDPRILEKKYAYAVKMNGRNPQFSGAGAYASLNISIPANEWHHVAFSFARGEVHGYYDGRELPFLANAFDGGANISLGNQGTTIGNDQTMMTPLNGRLDEMRIYNRALTLAEIAELAK